MTAPALQAPAVETPLGALVGLLRADARLASWRIAQPHPLVVSIRDEAGSVVVVAPSRAWDGGRDRAGADSHATRWGTIRSVFADAFSEARAALVLLGTPPARGLDEALKSGLCAILPAEPSVDELLVAAHSAFELIGAKQRSERRGEWVNRYRFEIGEFIEIARAITTEREIDKLLALILEKARFIANANAGSIYVVEGDDPDMGRRTLRFKLTQNDSVSFDASEFVIPISERSMSGYAALHRTTLNIADVYDLPPGSPYGFDRSFDEQIGYRTKSMLCAPLLSRMGDVIGVLQLINRMKEPGAKLVDFSGALDQVIPFDARGEGMLKTLASLAGVALENAFLAADNERMLEGFVRASVAAIEQRDPTTSGHSIRVAQMTVGLAEAVERAESGSYRSVSWSGDDLRELEYAALLHDFGKIGVREQVLVKANKLYPHELELIGARFALAASALEVDTLQRKIDALRRGAPAAEIAALDEELEQRNKALKQALCLIRECNEPKVLSGGDFAVLEQIARQTYSVEDGDPMPLLAPGEVESLSVPRGSLTPAEFDEIRSHVVHTFHFLSAIPWGRKLRRVAQIAAAHHERLDGTGYPNRLRASEIPLQSKIMAVSDIFDALTAADRPYKKAVPLGRALDILNMEVREGHIDPELVRIFVEAEVWRRLDTPPG